MVNTLHEQLLDEIKSTELATQGFGGNMSAESLGDALRAVVELHAPVPCRYNLCNSPETHYVCSECGSAHSHPCSTVRAVASALGVETAEGQDRAGS